MSRLPFPPDRWSPTPELRRIAEDARALFSRAHGLRRLPKDHDPEAELRAIAWELEPIRTEQLRTLVYAEALERNGNHFPRPNELRDAWRAVWKRTRAAQGGRANAPEPPPQPLPDFAEGRLKRWQQRDAAILRALGFEPGTLPVRTEAHLLATCTTVLLEHVEAIAEARCRERQAEADRARAAAQEAPLLGVAERQRERDRFWREEHGPLGRAMSDFTWPSPDDVEAILREKLAAGHAQLAALGRQAVPA